MRRCAVGMAFVVLGWFAGPRAQGSGDVVGNQANGQHFHVQWAFAANGVYSSPSLTLFYRPSQSSWSYGIVAEFQEIIGYMKYDYEPDLGIALQFHAPLGEGLRFVAAHHFILASTAYPNGYDGIKGSALMGIQQTHGDSNRFFTALMAGLRMQAFTRSLEDAGAKVFLPQAALSLGYQF